MNMITPKPNWGRRPNKMAYALWLARQNRLERILASEEEADATTFLASNSLCFTADTSIVASDATAYTLASNYVDSDGNAFTPTTEECYVGVLVFDTFTDTDGTLLTDHTPDRDVVGGGWTVVTNTMDIQSNELRYKNTTNDRTVTAFISHTAADSLVEALMQFDNNIGRHTKLLCRYKDTANNWSQQMTNSSGAKVRLYEKVANVNTERGSYTSLSVAGDYNTHEIRDVVDTIECYFNDVLVITYASATSLKTELIAGIELVADSSYVATDIAADDFKITEIA